MPRTFLSAEDQDVSSVWTAQTAGDTDNDDLTDIALQEEDGDFILTEEGDFIYVEGANV